jgi:SET domain-containing protein
MMKYFLYGITYQNVEYEMGEKHFVSIKASKDIKAGEELIAAYSPTYWTNKDTTGVTETTSAYIKYISKSDPKRRLFSSPQSSRNTSNASDNYK